MKNLFIILCLTLSLIGCKTATINQKENKKRVGLWIEEYSIDSTKYKSVGKYKNGVITTTTESSKKKFTEKTKAPLPIIIQMERFNPKEKQS